MRLIASTRFLWPFEGHQTFSCHLRVFSSEDQDLVVASDEGHRGEVDSSITDQAFALIEHACRRFGLGGPGRSLTWVEHYVSGWGRQEAHPSGAQPGTQALWTRVVLVRQEHMRPGDLRMPEGRLAARWLAWSQAQTESLTGQPWGGSFLTKPPGAESGAKGTKKRKRAPKAHKARKDWKDDLLLSE